MDRLITWSAAGTVAVTFAVYLVSLAFYRLFLHPLSKFPGPRLAAVTRYYEGYYDVWQNGQYTFKIAELHKIYGPIIRISPHELHVNDVSFYDTIYRQDVGYDKDPWAYDAFGVDGGSVVTTAHNVHKGRRGPLAPYFSQAKVTSAQVLIQRHINKLHQRLEGLAKAGTKFNLGAAMTALTRDVANDYVLNKSYNSLDKEDFDILQLTFSHGAGAVWRLSKFVRFIGPTLQSIPISLVNAIGDVDTKEFFRHIADTQEDTKRLMMEATTRPAESMKRRNLVDEIMDAKLPLSEKSFRRVFAEVATTTGAGFETTASVLRLIAFHIFNNQAILRQLRSELAASNFRYDSQKPDWKALAQLPYLTAVIQEGLRLSPAIAARMARISRSGDIRYKEWSIPAGTPVGMTTILMHTDESIWPQPMRFNPDRWIKDGSLIKVDKGYAPFGKGTRNCAGQMLAWAEIYLVFADLVLHFDFEYYGAKAEDFEASSDQFAIGTTGKGNLEATVSIRKQ